jgi:16S rRNA (guanine527-N7)-methyltransferase
LLDIGSGGGFPSIPLKIVRPDIDILSVDSVQKKINFQRQVARLLGFEKFKAAHARVEELVGEYGERFDFAVARAVAEIALLGRMATPFLSENGKLIAMKGSRWKEELEESESELPGLGLCVSETRELRLPIIGDLRCLILLKRQNKSNASECPEIGR